MYDVLKKLHETANMTIFLTSHDTNDIETLCERAIIINNGKKIFDDALETLFSTIHQNKYITYRPFGQIEDVTIDVPKSELTATLQKLMKDHEIEDLQISSPSLEEIITHYYTL